VSEHHLGLFAAISEANEIRDELDVPLEEALAIQRQREIDRRVRADAPLETNENSNVIFVNFTGR
jgi:hypothetical protein